MELVVGLAITGMMAAAGVGAFSSIVDHRRVVREASMSTERAGALREMITSWIYAGTIAVQRGGGPRGLTRNVAGATQPGAMNRGAVSAAQASGDELTFTTSAPNPLMLANVRMRLFVDDDPNTPEHGLTVEYQPNVVQPLVRRMLDSTIDSLHVEYLDQRTNRWYPASEAATITILAARLWMHSTDSTQSPLLALPMTFAIGNPSLSPANRGIMR